MRSILMWVGAIAMAATLLTQAAVAEEKGPVGLRATLLQRENGVIIVRFANEGEQDLVVFRPLDGSEWGWHWPHYRFTVTGEDGKQVPLPVRCKLSGLWRDTEWPKDYAIKLRPEEAAEIQVRVPQLPRDGTYRVRFEYEVGAKAANRGGWEMPEGTWYGKTQASEIVVKRPTTRGSDR